MCSHHPSFTRQHHLLTCTFAEEQILSQQASQLQNSIASRSLFMFLTSAASQPARPSHSPTAARTPPRPATFLHWSPEHRSFITLHLTHARGRHFILSLEPRIPCPCKKIIINNVITITIIINYNYFCPPEALHRPRTPCLRSSAAAALPRGPRPRLQF